MDESDQIICKRQKYSKLKATESDENFNRAFDKNHRDEVKCLCGFGFIRLFFVTVKSPSSFSPNSEVV